MAGMSLVPSLGPHAAYILASYGVGVAIIGGLLAVIVLRARAAQKRLHEAEHRSSGQP